MESKFLESKFLEIQASGKSKLPEIQVFLMLRLSNDGLSTPVLPAHLAATTETIRMINRREFSRAVCAALIGYPLAAWAGLAPAGAGLDDNLAKELARLEAESGGRLGVAVLDTSTGAMAGHRADQPFPMCSTFKVLAVGAILGRVDAHAEKLDRRIVSRPRRFDRILKIESPEDGLRDEARKVGFLLTPACSISAHALASEPWVSMPRQASSTT